ncbi:MAG TPA: hypothetical protein H9790_07660 [Candidatus Agathobaculum intestinipullorum]|nr:hypothetical protein [Candidatus Agathobaculum intestinipullorum]
MSQTTSSTSDFKISRSQFEAEVISNSAPDSIDKISDKTLLDELNEFNKNNLRTINQRDTAFNDLLNAFIIDFKEKSGLKRSLKQDFYSQIMELLRICFAIPIVIVLSYAAFGSFSDTAFIIAAISSFVELIAAFIILPRIIAKYLFNTKEDSQLIKIIKSMQEYNDHRHNHLSDSQPQNTTSREQSQDS